MRSSSAPEVHIVAFDIPVPADYGGAIDIFYKIRSLHEAGVQIYLHCFEYGREHAALLEQYCREVYYYPRHTGWSGLSLRYPYIVYSRRSKLLLERLLKKDVPVLFEGVHSALLLAHPALEGRYKLLRNHNVEHQYYRLLAGREPNALKRLFFRMEASLLRRFEHQLAAAAVLLPISAADTQYFQQQYPGKKVVHLPAFHPYDKVISATGSGAYCLYQGNLAHPENIEAVLFLLEQVFPGLDVPFIVAGRDPHPAIVAACAALPGCTLVAQPDAATMELLIRDAQLHVLPTFQASGLKLKLLYALFAGRHVLANDAMLHGSDLSALCHTANTAAAFKIKIPQLMATEFTIQELERRKELLQDQYRNSKNAQRIIRVLQG